MRWMAITIVAACSKNDPKVTCGKGTTLRNNVCEVTEAVPAIPAVPVDAGATDQIADAASQESQSGWQYQEKVDQMRGGKVQLASLRSSNTVEFGSPYGSSHMQLMLRNGDRASGVDFDAFFVIERGQFDCGIDRCFISYKFDDEKVERGLMNRGKDTQAIFFIARALFFIKLKESKTMMVEAEFFREGRRQFTFDVAGLNFEMPGADAPRPKNKKPDADAESAEPANPKNVREALGMPSNEVE